MGPDAMREALRRQQELALLLEESGDDDHSDQATVEGLIRDAERWREFGGGDGDALADELNEARDRIDLLEAQARSLGGRGTDHPSCWYDRDGSPAYLFDVALLNDGFVIDIARAPEHGAERRSLPIDEIQLQRVISASEFRVQTRPVHLWSKEREPECRFFVRAFDRTAADQKELYKRRMQVLEEHFYKYANPTGDLPEGLRLGAAR